MILPLTMSVDPRINSVGAVRLFFGVDEDENGLYAFLDIVLTLHGSPAWGPSSNLCSFLSFFDSETPFRHNSLDRPEVLRDVLNEGPQRGRTGGESGWSLSFFIGPSATLLSPSLPRLNVLRALCPAFLVFTSAFKTPDVPLMLPSPPCTALSDAVCVTSECSATDFSRSCDNESPELPLILLFPILD